MVGNTVDVVWDRLRIEGEGSVRLDVQVLAVLLLHDVLAVADVGDVIVLSTALGDGEAGVLRNVLAVESAGDVESGAFLGQRVEDPALVLRLVSGGGLGGGEDLGAVAGVGEGIAVGLKDKVAALSQIAADALEAILEEEGLLFCLVSIGNASNVLVARAAASPCLGAEAVVQTDELALSVGERRLGLRKVRDAVVGLCSSLVSDWLNYDTGCKTLTFSKSKALRRLDMCSRRQSESCSVVTLL